MHFCFVGQEVLVKQPVQGYWQKQLIAKIKPKTEKHVINVTAVFLLMPALL